MTRNPNWGGARPNRSALARPTVKRIELDDDVAQAARNACIIRHGTATKQDVQDYVNDLIRRAIKASKEAAARVAAQKEPTMTAQTIYDIRDRHGDFDGETMHALFEVLTGDPSPSGADPILMADLVRVVDQHPNTYVGEAAAAVLVRLGQA